VVSITPYCLSNREVIFLALPFRPPTPILIFKVKKKKLGNFNEKALLSLNSLVSFLSLVSFILETYINKSKKRVKKSQKQ